MEYINADRTVGTYRSHGGEHAFINLGFVLIEEARPRFAGAVRSRRITEAYFVPEEEAAKATEVIRTTVFAGRSLRAILDEHLITFRLPWGVQPAAPVAPLHVVEYPARTSRRAA